MVLRRIIPIFAAYFCLSPLAAQQVSPSPSPIPPSSTVEHTQDLSEVVLPISSFRFAPSVKLRLSGKISPKLGVDAGFGTGFCLDPACRFVATNYHVAVVLRPHKIKGERILQRYLATGSDDEGATVNHVPNVGPLPFAKKRDLAIFELQRPLPHHHGPAFSLDELQLGQEVDIYGYPTGAINPFRKLTRFPAIFKAPTTSGLLAFDYVFSETEPIRIGGASGGIVVDRKTKKVVGILSSTTETTALAVPVHTLVDFVSKVQPFLAQKIFPITKEVSPVSADIYPKFVPPPDLYPQFAPTFAHVLQRRPQEPHEVALLRQKAQLLADSMRNFIAVQTFAWGSGDKEPSAQAAYEVRMIDGEQRFRRYPDGKKDSKEVPFPRLSGWTLSSDEWSRLPTMVGTEFRLKVHQAADAIVGDRRIKVFQYYSSVEDNLCPFMPIEDYIFFTVSKVVPVACYGEVWTDEDTNIVRMSKHLDLSDKLKEYKGWEDYQVVLTYGWLNRADEPPRLVPLSTFTVSRHKKNKDVYWCRGQFVDYQVFTVRARIMPN